MNSVIVVGAGLAGSEAAWQLAERGIEVELYEMKPEKRSPAHHADTFAELVCSNSLKAEQLANAHGLLKEELRRLNSLIISCADATRIEAGGALAVDREAFSGLVTEKIRNHAKIKIISRELTAIPEDREIIIATGPLTSDALSAAIGKITGAQLYFHDAAAPIVAFDSIDMDRAFFASRYDKGTPDYINCPMNEEEYQAFYEALLSAEAAPSHDFEKPKLFEGCMPVEFMALRGRDTMRFGPLKPVGLKDPVTGRMPYAVVQLRKDNAAGTLYNMVGFQTHLKFPEQKRVFSMIPALENARFERYGVMHRNTFLDSPKLLDRYYRLRSNPSVCFAGQMTGVEGYVESAASGFLASVELARRLKGETPVDFPAETAIGALAEYISGGSFAGGNFQPMNINFGIIAPLTEKVRSKKDRNAAISARSLETIGRMAGKL